MNPAVLLFGGAFDPFHHGHQSMLDKVLKQVHVTDVIIMPNKCSPNKQTALIPGKTRLNLLTALLPELPQATDVTYHCSDYEMQASSTGYTIDTIAHLETTYPNKTLILLIGSDNFFSFHHWKAYDSILNKVILCVVPRETINKQTILDYIKEKLHQHPFKGVIVLSGEPMNISSTQIKETLHQKQPIQHWVPESIDDYFKGEKP